MTITLIDPDTHILDIHRDLSVAARARKPGPPERIEGMSVGIVTVEGALSPRGRGRDAKRRQVRGTE